MAGRCRNVQPGRLGAVPMPEQTKVKNSDRRALTQRQVGEAKRTNGSTEGGAANIDPLGANPKTHGASMSEDGKMSLMSRQGKATDTSAISL